MLPSPKFTLSRGITINAPADKRRCALLWHSAQLRLHGTKTFMPLVQPLPNGVPLKTRDRCNVRALAGPA